MTFIYDHDRYKNEPKLYEIVVKGDTNDADYVTKTNDISALEIAEIVQPALELIKANGGYVPFSEYSYEWSDSYEQERELMEIFREFYCPYGEYGIHSIESVVYYNKPNKVKLF